MSERAQAVGGRLQTRATEESPKPGAARWGGWGGVKLSDLRPFVPCAICHDFGMLEDGQGNEDVCPTCEGGIWRERISWRAYVSRLRLPFGLRIAWLVGWPRIYRDWSP